MKMAAPRALSNVSAGLASSIASTAPTPAAAICARGTKVVVGQRSRAASTREEGQVSVSARDVAASACLGKSLSMRTGIRPTTSKIVARRSGWGGLDLFSKRVTELTSSPADFDGAFARRRSFRIGRVVRGAGKAPGGQSQQTGGALPVAEKDSVRLSYQWPESKNPRICILGGGFGGLYTALRLESLTWAPEKRPEIMLIDQSDRFVFKPMLYEILSKEVNAWEIAPKFSDLLSNTRIRFLQDSVKAVSPSDSVRGSSSPSALTSSKSTGGTVFLDGGDKVDYDWLVLALGAETRLDLVPGALEFALPFATLENALEVDRRVLALERARFGLENSPIEVIVVGSGYCGVELAATLAERLGKRGKVQVVDPNPEICSSATVGNREAASKVLTSRGVNLELGYYVNGIREFAAVGGAGSESNGSVAANASPKKLSLDLQQATQKQTKSNRGSRQLNADLVLWTIGNKPKVPSGTDADYQAFPLTGRGQADTDETLRVRGHPRIFAIGDSAGMKDSTGRLLPGTAQVAFQQADYAGWNLWAAINDRPLLPFRYQHLGEMMTLGRTDAAVTLGFIDVTLDGILGHSARKLAYLYRLPKDDHKAKVAFSWLAKSTVNTFSFIQGELTRVLGST